MAKDDKLINARVLARMQKDLDGFIQKYEAEAHLRIEKYAKEVGPIWERTAQRLELQIKKLYKEHEAAIQAQREDKAQTIRFKAQRLRLLQREIDRLLQGANHEVKLKLDKNLAYEYSRAYYFNAFGLEQAGEVKVNVPLLTQTQVLGVLSNPWLPDAKTYSDRLRGNTAFLAEKMKAAIGRAQTEGWDTARTAQEIRKTAGEGYYNSIRLARTESKRAASQGANLAFMQNADILDGKRWNATLDKRTAPKDASNDGKIYELDYDTPSNPGRAGERIPNHPFCRCKYSPVLSALGVSTKQRIARDENDNRTWTKARTYEEYADERGLPKLEDRLRNDDPRRYLQQGETMDAYNRPVNYVKIVTAADVTAQAAKAAEAAKAAPATQTLAEKVQARIAQGMKGEADYGEVGAIIHEEIKAAIGDQEKPILDNMKTLAEIQAEQDAVSALRKEVYKYTGDEFNKKVDEYNKAIDQLNDNIAAYNKARKDLSELRGRAVRDKLAEVRPLGTTVPQKWVDRSNKEVKGKLDMVRGDIPTPWAEAMANRSIFTKKVKRGYHMGYSSYTEIALSGSGSSMDRVAYHETGHLIEELFPQLYDLEKEFYNRRTAGESLQWLGSGYKKAEKARFDKFRNKYMGKDYGANHKFTEVFSMGMEGVFKGSNDLHLDEDYYNFILGILGAL